MSDSSASLSSPWAALFFTPIPEGQIFTCPSPWIVGDRRAYHLSNAQAEQLAARLLRAHWVGAIGVGAFLLAAVLALVGISHMVTGSPSEFFDSHPIGYVFALVVLTLLVIGLYVACFWWAAARVLAGLPWTVAPRTPDGLKGNSNKIVALEMLFPTWALAIGFVIYLVGTPFFGVPAVAALVSGRLTFDLFAAVMFLMMAVISGAALIAKLKRSRAGK
jgi:hypothetical protein